MGNCRYCGKPAGLLRNAHTDCETEFTLAPLTIGGYFTISIQEGKSQEELIEVIQEVAADTNFTPQVAREVICKGWKFCVESALTDGLLTQREESYLIAVRDHFDLSQQELDLRHTHDKLVQAAALRDVQDNRDWLFWVH
jgi:hypothetical protein